MCTLLPPDVKIKPVVSNDDVERIIKNIYGLILLKATELNAYDDRNFHILAGSTCNPSIPLVTPQGYVLKIINVIDSANSEIVDGQTKLLLHVAREIAVPKPVRNLDGGYYSFEKFCNSDGIENKHIVRLFEFCPGRILKEIKTTDETYFDIGKWLGQLQKSLTTFDHPVFKKHRTVWHLISVPEIKSFMHLIVNEKRKTIVESVVQLFENNVIPKITLLNSGIIHGDFNEQNILVNDKKEVTAILDFGDSQYAPYIFDIAICLCYMMIEAKRNQQSIAHVAKITLKGYQSIRKISDVEKQHLVVCIAARICQSLVLGLYTSSLEPDNEYITGTQEHGWNVLEEFWLQGENFPLY